MAKEAFYKKFEMEALDVLITSDNEALRDDNLVQFLIATPKSNTILLRCSNEITKQAVFDKVQITGVWAFAKSSDAKNYFIEKGFVESGNWLTLPDDVLGLESGKNNEEAEALLQLLFDYISPRARLLKSAGTRFYFEFSTKPGLKLNESYQFFLDKVTKSENKKPAVKATEAAGNATKTGSNSSEPDAEDKARNEQLSFNGQVYRYYTSRFKHTFFSFDNNDLNREGTKDSWITQYQLPLVRTNQQALPKLAVGFDDGAKVVTSFISELNLSVLDSSKTKSNVKKDEDETVSYLLNFLCQPASPANFNVKGWRTVLLAFAGDEALKQGVLNHQTEYWLRFNSNARIIKKSYLEQKDEGKIGDVTLSNVKSYGLDDVFENEFGKGGISGVDDENEELKKTSPSDYFERPHNRVIQELISVFFTDRAEFANAFQEFKPDDSRMFTLSHLAYEANYPTDQYALCQVKKVFEFLKYVDYFEAYSYNADFISELGKMQDYTRWNNTTSMSSFNEFAATTMGFGWFPCNIQYRHWLSQYNYFIEYALLSRHFLNGLANRVRRNTEKMLSENESDEHTKEHFRDLRRDFLTFMNSYWFTQVSKEQQGIELYTKCKDALGLESEFQAVKNKIEWADEFVESRRDIALSKSANMIAMIALLAAFLSGGIDYFLVAQHLFGWTIPGAPSGDAASYSWVNLGLNVAIAITLFVILKRKLSGWLDSISNLFPKSK